jgi:endoglucanase Acf2
MSNQPTKRPPKSQFHYFYGSTTTNPPSSTQQTTTTRTTRTGNVCDEIDNIQNEQDSLVGEELVSTDNEGETELHSLIGNGMKKKSSEGKTTSATRKSSMSFGIGTIVIFLVIACAVAVLAVLLIPHTSDPLPESQTFTIPFPQVDRSEYGDPVEDFINMDLFHPSLIAPPETPHAFVFPFPTGAFWTNLVVQSPIGDISYPIAVYPYAYRWSSSSIQVSYPAGHRVVDKHTIQDTFAPDLTITTVEDTSKRYVTEFDPLSVTLRFVSTSDSKWETALVQGSPYVTMQYLKTTPVFKPLSIFSAVQCPGDEDENFSDLLDDVSDNEGTSSSSSKQQDFHRRRQLFGVCSMEVRDYE